MATFERSAAGRAQYDAIYQKAPILLQGGIAGSTYEPITTFMPSLSPDTIFLPVEGAVVVSQSIGMYPFANQSVAANATIQQPLTISMRMVSPVTEPGGYATKNNAFNSLAKSLQQHNAAGGTYIIYSPAYTYTATVMTAMTDVTQGGENSQLQIEWQLDFIQPILTVQAALAAENRLISLLSGGQLVTPNAAGTLPWSGLTGSAQTIPGNAASLTGLQNVQLTVNATQ